MAEVASGVENGRRLLVAKRWAFWVVDIGFLGQRWPIFAALMAFLWLLNSSFCAAFFTLHSSLKNRPSYRTFSAQKGRNAEILCHFHALLPLGKIIGARGSLMFFEVCESKRATISVPFPRFGMAGGVFLSILYFIFSYLFMG